MSRYVIDSYESAFKLLDQAEVLTSDTEPFELVLGGIFKELQIRIFGPSYHGELTGELARGIAVFQDELYRATLNILNSMGAEQGRLTASQKELISLRVEVKENCTLINFDFDKLSEGLVNVFKSMPPKYLVITILSLGLIGATGWVASDLGGKYIEAEKVIAQDKEQTARTELAQKYETERNAANAANLGKAIDGLIQKNQAINQLSNKVSQELTNATRNGVREVAVRATNATAVEVGRVHLDEEALSDLRKRSPRTSPYKQDFIEPCGIIRFHKGAPSKLLLSCPSYGEFNADIDESEFSPEKLDVLHEVFKKGSAIDLAVTLLISGEKIKSAVVLDIEPEKVSESEELLETADA